MKVLIALALVAAVCATPLRQPQTDFSAQIEELELSELISDENVQIQNGDQSAVFEALLPVLEYLRDSEDDYNKKLSFLDLINAINTLRHVIIKNIVKIVANHKNSNNTHIPSEENSGNVQNVTEIAIYEQIDNQEINSTEELDSGLEITSEIFQNVTNNSTDSIVSDHEVSIAINDSESYDDVSDDGVTVNDSLNIVKETLIEEEVGNDISHSETENIINENKGSDDLSDIEVKIVNTPNALTRQNLYQTQYNPIYQPQYNPIYQPQYNPIYQPQYNPIYQPQYNPRH